MKYYRFEGECDGGKAVCHVEVDVERDMVTRQVTTHAGSPLRGAFDGSVLTGEIADCSASELGFRPEEEIGREVFEHVWNETLKAT